MIHKNIKLLITGNTIGKYTIPQSKIKANSLHLRSQSLIQMLHDSTNKHTVDKKKDIK